MNILLEMYLKGIILLDIFVIENMSFKIVIEKVKVFIFYFLNGMYILLLGEIGVGKFMFVFLMYEYVIEVE